MGYPIIVQKKSRLHAHTHIHKLTRIRILVVICRKNKYFFPHTVTHHLLDTGDSQEIQQVVIYKDQMAVYDNGIILFA